MCEVTRKDSINNESIRGNLKVALIEGRKIKECNLDQKQLCTLYGRVINKDPEWTRNERYYGLWSWCKSLNKVWMESRTDKADLNYIIMMMVNKKFIIIVCYPSNHFFQLVGPELDNMKEIELTEVCNHNVV